MASGGRGQRAIASSTRRSTSALGRNHARTCCKLAAKYFSDWNQPEIGTAGCPTSPEAECRLRPWWPRSSTQQTACEGIEVGAGELRIVSAVKAAIVNEVGVRESVCRRDMLSVERLQLNISGDHRPNLDAGFSKSGAVPKEDVPALADERHRERRDGRNMAVVDRNKGRIGGHHALDFAVVAQSRRYIFRQQSKLSKPEETCDLGRANVKCQIIERVLGIELGTDVMLFAQAYLIHRRKVSVPTVRPRHAEHGRELRIVGSQHAAFDGGHMVRDKERERGRRTKTAGLALRQFGAERLAIVLDQDDFGINASAANFPEIPCESKRVGDEYRLEVHLGQPVAQGPGGNIESIAFAVDRYRLQSHLDDGHDVRGPCQG